MNNLQEQLQSFKNQENIYKKAMGFIENWEDLEIWQ